MNTAGKFELRPLKVAQLLKNVFTRNHARL